MPKLSEIPELSTTDKVDDILSAADAGAQDHLEMGFVDAIRFRFDNFHLSAVISDGQLKQLLSLARRGGWKPN